MRYEHETCTKITPKEYAIMVVSKNDQVYKVSHIILYTRHTSHGNTTQLDNIIESSFTQMVKQSQMELLLVCR